MEKLYRLYDHQAPACKPTLTKALKLWCFSIWLKTSRQPPKMLALPWLQDKKLSPVERDDLPPPPWPQ